MRNSQKSIDAVCEHRGLPKIKKGARCEVNGEGGIIFGGNSAANFNVKWDASGSISNCHPGWRMKIMGEDGAVIYKSEHS